MPELSAPQGYRAIANAHFKVEVPPGVPPMQGIINATTEWIFAFPGRLSVTISNADRLMDVPRAMLAQTIWQEVSRIAGVAGEMPPWQIVRERRATFAATPEENAKRPMPRTKWRNLVSGRRLDRDRAAGHLGKRGAIGPSRGGAGHGRRRRMTDRASARPQYRLGDQGAARLPSARTANGASSSKPTAPFRPNTFCCGIISAEPVDAELERKIAVYLRRTQGPHGGWPLFHDGEFDMSASVKAYFRAEDHRR